MTSPIIDNYEHSIMDAHATPLPSFRPGDSLRVHVKVKEGERERVQIFEGVCIGRKMRGLGSAFTVRKVSYGEGVERIFPLYSPRIAKIEVMREGRVRQAKLYYLRGLSGRKARIGERKTFTKKEDKPFQKNQAMDTEIVKDSPDESQIE